MYAGHLLFVRPEWLAWRLSSNSSETAHLPYCARGPLPGVRDDRLDQPTGDPLFLLGVTDVGPALLAHAAIAWGGRMPLPLAWRKFGRPLGVADEAELVRVIDGGAPGNDLVDVLVLSHLVAAVPPVSLDEAGVEPRTTLGRELTPEETLLLLRSLHQAAQTEWTRRVVLRDNDLPLAYRPGDIVRTIPGVRGERVVRTPLVATVRAFMWHGDRGQYVYFLHGNSRRRHRWYLAENLEPASASEAVGPPGR